MPEQLPASDVEVRAEALRLLSDLSAQSSALTAHVTQLTEFVAKLDARLEGAMSMASVIDENEERSESERWIAAQKEALGSFYSEAQKYTTVVVAGAYAAYFTTFAMLADRFRDRELSVAAILMTISLTIFALWEVAGMAGVSWRILKGTLEAQNSTRAREIGWGLAMLGTLGTAIPAIGLSLWVYLRHLL